MFVVAQDTLDQFKRETVEELDQGQNDVEMQTLQLVPEKQVIKPTPVDDSSDEEDMQETIRFLTQVPPDWQAAANHGKANMVLDSSKMFSKDGERCPCCDMLIPDVDDKFPVSISNLALGELGHGFPLLFQFLKFTNYILLILCLIFFLPISIWVGQARTVLAPILQNSKSDNDLPMFSIGSLVKYSSDNMYQYMRFPGRMILIEYYSLVMMVAMIVINLLLIVIRKLMIDDIQKLNDESLTPADFCIMGKDLKFNSDTLKGKEQELRDYLKTNYQITESEIEYINFAFDISAFYGLIASYTAANTKFETIRGFVTDLDITMLEYQQMLDANKPPENSPCDQAHFWNKKDYYQPQILRKEIDNLEIQIDESDDIADLSKEIKDNSKFTGTAFIVLNDQKLVQKVLKDQSSNIVRFFKIFFSCCMDVSKTWKFSRAPEPKDVLWENLGVSFAMLVWRNLVTTIAALAIITLQCVAIVYIKVGVTALINTRKDDVEFQKGQVPLFINGFIVPQIVTYVNDKIVVIFVSFANWEGHRTVTDRTVYLALKLALVRFANSTFFQIYANQVSGKWFDNMNLVHQVSVQIILLCFQQPFLDYLVSYDLVAGLKLWWQRSKGKDCKMTQQEANASQEGTGLDIANLIADFIHMIMVCWFYAPLIPIAIPFCLLGGTIRYFLTKYSLLRRNKMPDAISPKIAIFFLNLMPWITMMWGFTFYFFINEIANVFQSKSGNDPNYNNYSQYVYPGIGLGFSIFFAVFPTRSLFEFNQKDLEGEDRKYKEIALLFPTDYDKENPLTSQLGAKRLVNLQIEEAKKGEDHKLVEKLMKKDEKIGQQTVTDRIQSYANTNEKRKENGGPLTKTRNDTAQRAVGLAQHKKSIKLRQKQKNLYEQQAIKNSKFQNKVAQTGNKFVTRSGSKFINKSPHKFAQASSFAAKTAYN